MLGALVFTLAACSQKLRSHGYVPTPEDLQQVIVGVDTRDTIAEIVGRPSAAGLLSENAWYYVRDRFREYGLGQPRAVDREVVVISFDENGVVKNIERFGMEKGRVVVLSRRVTDSNVEGVGFLRQLFGNVGAIDLGEFL